MSGDVASSSRGLRWLRSSHARFIGLILLLEILFGAALLLSVTQLIRADLDEADRAVAVETRNILLALRRDEGDAAMMSAIAEQARAGNAAVILLIDRQGQRIAGNLSTWPPTIAGETGWLKTDLYRIGDDRPATFGIVWARLPDGRRLLVGEKTDDTDQIRETVEFALLTAMLLALPLALVGAWLVVTIIDRRIANIAAAAAGVGAGDIARRVPIDGSGDSFDMLGSAINAMLDRIGELLAELRTVTDSIAHDLRSPLTRMRARIDRALETEDKAALRSAIEGISREADQLLAMLGTALEISRMEAGIGRDRFSMTDLGQQIENISELYEPLVEEQGRSLAVMIDAPESAPVHRELLSQALANIIDNAIKYGAGAMTLYVRREANMIVLGLSDQGAGIPLEREAEALRRFGRLDSARGLAGAGLGLSLVAAVARMHDGALRFDRRDGLFAVEILIAVRD